MAATVSSSPSPWSKPGAWALDSEQSEAELTQPEISSDFPTLAAAKSVKPAKKKKAQKLSLAEFTAAKSVDFVDPVVLPTGPRERSAEEMDRGRLGGGFKSYGSGRDEPRKLRDPLPPSRADGVDNWGAGKKSGGFERREKGFFGDSKADEVDNWGSGKSLVSKRSDSDTWGRRRDGRGVGFGLGIGGGSDSDNWGRKSEDFTANGNRNGRGVGFGLGIGGGADSDNWGRKSEDVTNGNRNGVSFGISGGADSGNWGRKSEVASGNGVGRPRLVLQPRSVGVEEGKEEAVKGKGVSPFGEARPREEVLREKGQDWKEIDEKLEAVKIKEKVVERDGSFGKRGGRSDDRIERSWRKPEAEKEETEKVADEHPQSAETVENGGQPEKK